DAAVDDVLAVVAGVVPAAGDVERVVAASGHARHLGVAAVRGAGGVPRLAAVAGRDGVGDGDAAALRVEEGQRVDAELLVRGRVQVERQARLAVDPGRGGGARAPDLR